MVMMLDRGTKRASVVSLATRAGWDVEKAEGGSWRLTPPGGTPIWISPGTGPLAPPDLSALRRAGLGQTLANGADARRRVNGRRQTETQAVTAARAARSAAAFAAAEAERARLAAAAAEREEQERVHQRFVARLEREHDIEEAAQAPVRPSEAADLLGVAARTVVRWIETGQLPAVRVPGRGRHGFEYRIEWPELVAWVESNG
jgi:excisionase family DNA binding protein